MSMDPAPLEDDGAATAGVRIAALGPVEPDPSHLTITDAIYIVSRVAMGTVLVLLYALGVFQFYGHEERYIREIFVLGVSVFTLVGFYAIYSRMRLRRSPSRVLGEVLPFDLASALALVWTTGAYQDPFYPWLQGLAIAYAAALKRRGAWAVSIATAVVYMGGHYWGHGEMHKMDDFVLLGFKAAGLVFTGVVVSMVMHGQDRREQTLLASQREVEDLNARMSQRLNELHAVSEITEVIHSTLDFDRIGPLVLEILSKVIGLPSSALFVIDKDKDETVFSASSGVAVPSGGGLPDALLYGDGRGDETFACTTVLDHKRLMVVFCASGERLERMSAEDRLVLQAVSSELVVAVENSQLYKLTKRMAITDELTGLHNYRYLQQRLDDEIERAKRYTRSLSLLMLDADDFKKLNDTHGHVTGDVVLAEMADVLRSAVREIDVVCRYGGEEFAVVLPETDAEGAFVVAEKIREAVALHRFADAAGEGSITLTVSVGVATYPSTALDREELLRQADGALYNAKTTGRDRVRASARLAPVRTEEPADDAARGEHA